MRMYFPMKKIHYLGTQQLFIYDYIHLFIPFKMRLYCHKYLKIFDFFIHLKLLKSWFHSCRNMHVDNY
jgi:hypothetical protein